MCTFYSEDGVFFLGILGCCLHLGKPVSSSPLTGVVIPWVYLFFPVHPFRMREPQLSSLTWLPHVACTVSETHTCGSDCSEALRWTVIYFLTLWWPSVAPHSYVLTPHWRTFPSIVRAGRNEVLIWWRAPDSIATGLVITSAWLRLAAVSLTLLNSLEFLAHGTAC